MSNQDELKSFISNLLETYIGKFNSGDLSAAASFYDEPAVVISAEGVKLMPARKDYVSMFTETVARLRADGWDHSEFTSKSIVKLDDKGLVLASCPCKRLRADGTSVEEFTATYTLRKQGEGWVIASIHHHPYGTQLKS